MGVPHSAYHPNRASGNHSLTCTAVGTILFPIVGTIIGLILDNHIENYQVNQRMKKHEIPFWAKSDNGVNSFRNKK